MTTKEEYHVESENHIYLWKKTTIYDIPIFNTQFKILKSSHTNCFADSENLDYSSK